MEQRVSSLHFWLFGRPNVDKLTITHCVHSIGETLFALSLAGSVFFSVSPDAARPRVLLFLLLTVAPFLVMTPLIGPIIDRVRGGLGVVMATTFVSRAVLALLIAENLTTVLLFPLAFAFLVVAKTYSVTRNAIMPELVENKDDLVSVNSRLSRTATFASALAAAIGGSLYPVGGADNLLRLAALVYIAGAARTWLQRTVVGPVADVDPGAVLELFRPDVTEVIWDMLALRAAVGFALFHFGFSLRADNAPVWVVGAVIVANGGGGFAGTVVAPLARRRLDERSMLTASVLVASAATLVAGLALSPVTLIGAVFMLGTAASVGRRAMDSIVQRQAPHARRGQVYARLETRFELAWTLAAALAVAIRVDTRIGVVALAGFLSIIAALHIRRRQILRSAAPSETQPLHERLLMRARVLVEYQMYDEAVVIADAAWQVYVADHPKAPPPKHPDANQANQQSAIDHIKAVNDAVQRPE